VTTLLWRAMLAEALKNTVTAALIMLALYITVDLVYHAATKELTNRSTTAETRRK